MSRLAPLREEPTVGEGEKQNGINRLKQWLKTHFSPSHGRRGENDLKVLLSVLACPLFPISLQPQQPLDAVSSAQYILQQFSAATSCRKMEGKVRNFYATGRVKMAMVDDPDAGNGTPAMGCFVMWQMVPNKWSIELVLNGHKVAAGSDGAVAWRHTPWLGAHAAKGGVRPLRRALQGLDPITICALFSTSSYWGEDCVLGVDCFVLKLAASQSDLAERGDSAAEIIKHVISGYFSQKSGLMVYLVDTYLTRIQSPGTYPAYWETTMATTVEDYGEIEGGLVVAHGGETSVVITRFGDSFQGGGLCTRMVETWRIEDAAVNVEGLSLDCFIPPKEVRHDLTSQSSFLPASSPLGDES